MAQQRTRDEILARRAVVEGYLDMSRAKAERLAATPDMCGNIDAARRQAHQNCIKYRAELRALDGELADADAANIAVEWSSHR